MHEASEVHVVLHHKVVGRSLLVAVDDFMSLLAVERRGGERGDRRGERREGRGKQKKEQTKADEGAMKKPRMKMKGGRGSEAKRRS